MSAVQTPVTGNGPVGRGPVGRGPVGVAVIGAGNISKAYLDNLTVFPDLKVHVIADLFEEAAQERAKEYSVPEWGGVEAALNHPDVEIIVNLTIPAAHVEVATAAVRAGKHVWTEKPFSLDRESGLGLLKAADAAGIRLGCAPDTFLGAGLQTALRLIERGDIGTPLTAMTTFQTSGPESWHPNPAFLFQHGAGPLFDMGPYYLTTLIQAFGSIRKVAAVGSKAKDVRVIGSGPKAGAEFTVEVPTHVSAMAQFANGASSHSVFSFESPRVRTGFVEITGTEATISLPDPNHFDGDVRIWKPGNEDWTTVPATGPASGRGMGVLDMARSLRAGVQHRATGALAYHVLDTMVSITESMETGAFVDVESSAQASEALPEDWAPEAPTLSEGTP
ncbi:Gfo/Idh/MocA family protein [Arthrobacter rhizosphaerae]|uniref:Gfo/Idh/MocA family protein n=1 Tax=Arthrobacter rhizosphaerae TaxID=2855490 RepID=UPI001FF69625|nr:Gfo/Idh/MocA family oxidoreductase [Arthrobacter rhizosphaerae]